MDQTAKVSCSYLGSRAMAALRSRVPAGSGTSTSGVWHRRTCHPSSAANPVIGVIGRIGATALS
eukprot:803607-Pleurochrysis_carterae.AAC.5